MAEKNQGHKKPSAFKYACNSLAWRLINRLKVTGSLIFVSKIGLISPGGSLL